MRAIALFLFALPALAQTAGSARPFVKPQFFTTTGILASGYKICTYSAGTTSPALTYTTSGLGTPNANPIVLDSSGRASIFWGAVSLKIVMLLPSSTTTDCVNGTMSAIWTQDNIANNADLLKVSLASATGANLIGYRGNGNVTTTVGAALSSAFSYDSTFSTATLACASPITVAVTKQSLWNALSTQSCGASLWFPTGTGVSIQPASGQTVTLTANTNCPLTQQCFNTYLGGTIAFTTPPATLSPVQWGADITGAVDSSAAFLAAWTAARSGTSIGGSVVMPCGNFKFTSAVTFTTAQKQSMQGSGNCTTLTWAGGSSGASMLLFPNCFQCQVGNFYVNVTTALTAAIQTENAGSGYTASQDIFNGITIEGGNNLASCFLIDGPVDTNNDQQKFTDDHCYDATQAGWTLGNGSTGFNIFNVVMEHSSCSLGQYCVYQRHGNFAWYDGDVNGHSVADFHISSAAAGGFVIRNVESESSNALLTTSVDLSNPTNVEISNVNWADNCIGVSDPTEIATGCSGTTGTLSGNAITFNYTGILHVHDSALGAFGFGNALSVSCLANQTGTFPGNTGCQMENIIYGTSLTTLAGIFPQGFEKSINSTYIGIDGVKHLLPDTINSPTTFTQAVTFSLSPTLPTVATQTYSPVVAFGGASTGITYTVNSATYYVINGFTYIFGHITLSNKGSATGTATISLPTSATSGGWGQVLFASGGYSITTGISVFSFPTASIAQFNTQASTGSGVLADTNFTNTTDLYFSMQYVH